MRSRLMIAVAITFLAALVSSPMIRRSRMTDKPEVSSTQSKPRAQRKKIQPDLPGTINGALDPASIPDTVSFELLMRSFGDYPSEAAFKDFGLNADQVTNVLSYAQSFQQVMSTMDEAARVLRRSGSNPKELAKLQKQKRIS